MRSRVYPSEGLPHSPTCWCKGKAESACSDHQAPKPVPQTGINAAVSNSRDKKRRKGLQHDLNNVQATLHFKSVCACHSLSHGSAAQLPQGSGARQAANLLD